ncbi:chalcone isomerase family protein [Flavobacterium psychraquaticum]|uniref:chalcone isomerase family protein n=1 Tax=Flavobacterium psychraquaticum TaxID=3103958 RepID=UPI002ACEE9CD|nr:chalcone isomerase family protein [Flavobacterium sp. LB-N7T]
MKKILMVLFILLFNLSHSQEDKDFDGIKIKTSIKVEDGDSKTKLVLNGAGIREKMWVNLYVQALYLPEQSNDAEKILESDATIATRLHITSSLVTKKKLIQAMEDGISKSYKGDINLIKERLDTFMSFFETQLDKEGYADMVYSANKEKTAVYLNRKFIGDVPGKDFRKALFGIWLEDNCVDKTLRKRLLGM